MTNRALFPSHVATLRGLHDGAVARDERLLRAVRACHGEAGGGGQRGRVAGLGWGAQARGLLGVAGHALVMAALKHTRGADIGRDARGADDRTRRSRRRRRGGGGGVAHAAAPPGLLLQMRREQVLHALQRVLHALVVLELVVLNVLLVEAEGVVAGLEELVEALAQALDLSRLELGSGRLGEEDVGNLCRSFVHSNADAALELELQELEVDRHQLCDELQVARLGLDGLGRDLDGLELLLTRLDHLLARLDIGEAVRHGEEGLALVLRLHAAVRLAGHGKGRVEHKVLDVHVLLKVRVALAVVAVKVGLDVGDLDVALARLQGVDVHGLGVRQHFHGEPLGVHRLEARADLVQLDDALFAVHKLLVLNLCAVEGCAKEADAEVRRKVPCATLIGGDDRAVVVADALVN
eukprot:m.201427 g.201427  ORF g.201427 m.201427 type:complete len:409 (+) comp17705_c0_seq1:165-1391(+)